MDVHKLLEGVKDGEITIGEAEQYLKDLPYQDLGFCRLDHHRALRSGFGEVVYCPGKATEHLVKIYQCFAERKSNVLGTRASKEQYEAVKEVIPDVIYDPLGRTLKLQFDQSAPVGEIAVCTAGTSDISEISAICAVRISKSSESQTIFAKASRLEVVVRETEPRIDSTLLLNLSCVSASVHHFKNSHASSLCSEDESIAQPVPAPATV